VTVESGRLGGVRCGLSGPAPVQARRIGPRVHLWPIGAASGPPSRCPAIVRWHAGGGGQPHDR